jgi:hypothetical protein
MGGAGNVINWKTNADNKSMIYSELRDSLMLRRLEIRSLRLIQQMQAIVDDEGYISAGPDTGENDDLVSAMVLAHHAWINWKRDGLLARGYTWQSVHDRPPDKPEDVLMRVFSRHFQMINQKAQRRHQIF